MEPDNNKTNTKYGLSVENRFDGRVGEACTWALSEQFDKSM